LAAHLELGGQDLLGCARRAGTDRLAGGTLIQRV
jgi:hypothetical protein